MKKQLLEWAEEYIRSRDAHFRQIKDITVSGNRIEVQYPDNKVVFIATEKFSEYSFSDEKTVIVVPNSKENINTLVDRWDSLSKKKDLTLLFVNPDFCTFWKINPYTHNLICDKKKLKQGIKSISKNA